MSDTPKGSDATPIETFEHAGFNCVLATFREGYYCGYVQTDLNGEGLSPLEDIQAAVDISHSITYGLDRDGWVGFDTENLNVSCVDSEGEPLPEDRVYDHIDNPDTLSPEDVKEELKQLAEQLRKLQNRKEAAN